MKHPHKFKAISHLEIGNNHSFGWHNGTSRSQIQTIAAASVTLNCNNQIITPPTPCKPFLPLSLRYRSRAVRRAFLLNSIWPISHCLMYQLTLLHCSEALFPGDPDYLLHLPSF